MTEKKKVPIQKKGIIENIEKAPVTDSRNDIRNERPLPPPPPPPEKKK